MINSFHQRLQRLWYATPEPPALLIGLAKLFAQVVKLRRFAYQQGWRQSVKLPVPVIVVGNLTVGGTGKSPLVICLAELLRAAGHSPGIISRGYGGNAKQWPQRVFANSDPNQVGDEAVMLAAKTGCPVAVGPNRSKAAQLLLAETQCRLILSDDGLQHYGLQRTLEIVVIDSKRRFGNGYCLPAGPLRETTDRLNSVDLIIENGQVDTNATFGMLIEAEPAINLATGEKKPLAAFKSSPVHALAGIGNPQRFFDLLQSYQLEYSQAIFPDHHRFTASDIQFNDTLPVLMTEKDAVKCRAFATALHWAVPVSTVVSEHFKRTFLNLLEEKLNGS